MRLAFYGNFLVTADLGLFCFRARLSSTSPRFIVFADSAATSSAATAKPKFGASREQPIVAIGRDQRVLKLAICLTDNGRKAGPKVAVGEWHASKVIPRSGRPSSSTRRPTIVALGSSDTVMVCGVFSVKLRTRSLPRLRFSWRISTARTSPGARLTTSNCAGNIDVPCGWSASLNDTSADRFFLRVDQVNPN